MKIAIIYIGGYIMSEIRDRIMDYLYDNRIMLIDLIKISGIEVTIDIAKEEIASIIETEFGIELDEKILNGLDLCSSFSDIIEYIDELQI